MTTDGPDSHTDVRAYAGISSAGPLDRGVLSRFIGELPGLDSPERRIRKDASKLRLEEDRGRVAVANRSEVGGDQAIAQ